jgi:hypothetical protein
MKTLFILLLLTLAQCKKSEPRSNELGLEELSNSNYILVDSLINQGERLQIKVYTNKIVISTFRNSNQSDFTEVLPNHWTTKWQKIMK